MPSSMMTAGGSLFSASKSCSLLAGAGSLPWPLDALRARRAKQKTHEIAPMMPRQTAADRAKIQGWTALKSVCGVAAGDIDDCGSLGDGVRDGGGGSGGSGGEGDCGSKGGGVAGLAAPNGANNDSSTGAAAAASDAAALTTAQAARSGCIDEERKCIPIRAESVFQASGFWERTQAKARKTSHLLTHTSQGHRPVSPPYISSHTPAAGRGAVTTTTVGRASSPPKPSPPPGRHGPRRRGRGAYPAPSATRRRSCRPRWRRRAWAWWWRAETPQPLGGLRRAPEATLPTAGFTGRSCCALG